ncbi:MAG: polymorphic toxin-type HINT domain-containing protein [Pirellulaceae bacterium]|nr:polymorphic toxin-type HINT domain-containing protein [Pirellulaceae bacterium]
MFLDLDELETTGWAEVPNIGPCPEIVAGPGHVVTATFVHQPTSEILDVTITGSDGREETIGVTPIHPFWSLGHQAFVSVGQLSPGSRVKTHLDQIETITTLLPRPGPAEPVYNLEVHGEHVYYVGTDGVLVHNSDPKGICDASTAIGFAKGTADDAVRNVGRVDHAGRHLSDFGVIAGNKSSKAFREAVRSNAVRILENPQKTFDHVMRGQQVKGFYGMIDGKQVVFFVAKEAKGKIGIGELVTAVVPSPQQIINWGL